MITSRLFILPWLQENTASHIDFVKVNVASCKKLGENFLQAGGR
jgi:hypothetical protein